MLTHVLTPIRIGDVEIANRVVRTWLRIQMHNKPNLLLTLENWDGRPIMTYCGLPIRTVDQLVSSEARAV